MGRLSAVLNDPVRPHVVFRIFTYLAGILLLHVMIVPSFISKFLVNLLCLILPCLAKTEDAFLISTTSQALLVRIIPACTGFTDIIYYILLTFLFYGWNAFTTLRKYVLMGGIILLILPPIRMLLLIYLYAYSPLIAEGIHTILAVWGSFILIFLLALIPLLHAWFAKKKGESLGRRRI